MLARWAGPSPLSAPLWLPLTLNPLSLAHSCTVRSLCAPASVCRAARCFLALSQVPNGFIYLRAEPETCHRRMQRRNRSEEGGVPLEYLQVGGEWDRGGSLTGWVGAGGWAGEGWWA